MKSRNPADGEFPPSGQRNTSRSVKRTEAHERLRELGG